MSSRSPVTTIIGCERWDFRVFEKEEKLVDGKLDIDKLEAISFDPYTHGYYKVGTRVGNAFKDGLKIK